MYRNNLTGIDFDGYVDIVMEVWHDGELECDDQVRMKVAPWMGIAHDENSQEIFVENAPGLNDPLRAGLPGPTLVGMAESGTQWLQDHIEIGWTHHPGGPKMHSVFRLPYDRGGPPQPAWPQNHLLDGNSGTFQIGLDHGGESG